MISLENRLLSQSKLVSSISFVNWIRESRYCDDQKLVQLQNALFPGGDLDIREADYFLKSVDIIVPYGDLDNFFGNAY